MGKLFTQIGVEEVTSPLANPFTATRWRESARVSRLVSPKKAAAHSSFGTTRSKFARDNERPTRSTYVGTALATTPRPTCHNIYRLEEFKAEEIIYLTDARQRDHFQQLFLTTQKWFKAKGYELPEMNHVFWGTILGSDKNPSKPSPVNQSNYRRCSTKLVVAPTSSHRKESRPRRVRAPRDRRVCRYRCDEIRRSL